MNWGVVFRRHFSDDIYIDSRARNPRRVFIERQEGVQEGEGVMSWY